MVQSRKWGWKRIAANLLLVPVLTGGSAAAALGQVNPVPPGSGTAMAGVGKLGGDSKAMLKDGRKALAAGQFDRAQDLARAAEANNPTGKWGLFDDTPNALLKDVQSAAVKAQKSQADQLMKQAKGLIEKPASTDVAKAANLDQALQMALRADQLHGPYSAWDLSGRPDKMVKEIQAARAKLNVPAATAAPAMPAGGTTVGSKPKTPNIQLAGGTTPKLYPGNGSTGKTAGTPATGAQAATPAAKKALATQLMAEGQKHVNQGQFGAAKAKYMEADKVGASFGPNELNPGFALQDLNKRGSAAIDRLVAESRTQMGKKDYAKADAALTGAADVAASLGLFARPIEDTKAQLRTASAGKFGGSAAVGIVATGPDRVVPAAPVASAGPVAPASPMAPTGPVLNPPGNATVAVKPVAPVVPTDGPVTGKQLIDQAAFEFQSGELDMATKLAQQAFNLGAQDEARSLLNSIDAERLKLKTVSAGRSLVAAEAACKNKDYSQALGVLVLIDAKLLSPEQAKQQTELIATCRTELNTTGAVATVGGMQQPAEPPVGPSVPGTASVGSEPKKPGADPLTGQVDALRAVQAQKLRADWLKVQDEAAKAFGRGETDLAIQMLADCANRVRASGAEPASIAMIIRQIESRLDTFRVMKGQIDTVTRQKNDTKEAREMIAGRGAAEEQRKAEVQTLVRKYHLLVKDTRYADAEKVAMQAKQLDPDNPAIGQLAYMAKMNKRLRDVEEKKAQNEQFTLDGLNSAERYGPSVDIDNPINYKLERARLAGKRGAGNDLHLKTRTPAEYEIELKLDKPISIDFTQTPLDKAVEHLHEVTGLPLVIDYPALDAEGLSAVKPITVKPGKEVAARHIISFTLEQAGLSYVVENDLVKITSTKKAKGRLVTKVFSVADLVTPIPNFALPDYANFDKMINSSALTSGRSHIEGMTGATPRTPTGGLSGGVLANSQNAGLTPGVTGGLPFGPGGRLDSSPLAPSAPLAGDGGKKNEQLIKLITGMVRPYSWDGMGGPGKAEFFDIGSALVVNQTADVIREVEDLLEALRRLQDLAIAVEVRIVSLSETWYERMGVDFSMNIKTHTASFEPSLTQIDPGTGLSGVFRPTPFINDINREGVTVGLTPAGSFTGDLDVPIRPKNFEMAVPPFGGYPNTPGQNGGIALGLAFLNDIQVYMFMEAAQGDRRVNVMQAPKLTLFNGQTSTLNITDSQFFVTNVTVVSVNGQIVFIPNNTLLPGPNTNFNITIQGVVSADRRFVRLNLPITMSAQTGATVPLFPFTTFVTPVFEGGSQGQPIPFTQFLQQPAFTTLNINTTVVCPDGGTVLLGGLKTLSEGRNVFGTPVLSKIPYLNRLFKNVGIGRETKHIMIMVTPRIIINSEEEIFQTEGRPTVAN